MMIALPPRTLFCRQFVRCERPCAGAIGSRVLLRWECSPTEVALQFQDGYGRREFSETPFLLSDNDSVSLGTSGLVVRREAVTRSGWLEKSVLTGRVGKLLSSGEDMELVFRIRRAGYEVWYDPSLVIEHVIPARRMSIDYVCRLFQGFGESHAVLWALARPTEVTLAWRVRLLGSRLAHSRATVRGVCHPRSDPQKAGWPLAPCSDVHGTRPVSRAPAVCCSARWKSRRMNRSDTQIRKEARCVRRQ